MENYGNVSHLIGEINRQAENFDDRDIDVAAIPIEDLMSSVLPGVAFSDAVEIILPGVEKEIEENKVKLETITSQIAAQKETAQAVEVNEAYFDKFKNGEYSKVAGELNDYLDKHEADANAGHYNNLACAYLLDEQHAQYDSAKINFGIALKEATGDFLPSIKPLECDTTGEEKIPLDNIGNRIKSNIEGLVKNDNVEFYIISVTAGIAKIVGEIVSVENKNEKSGFAPCDHSDRLDAIKDDDQVYIFKFPTSAKQYAGINLVLLGNIEELRKNKKLLEQEMKDLKEVLKKLKKQRGEP